ncbi:hypothetical protein B0J14DRAFT_278619 [Halenospora varia]|nr:hypothetical protein B0J14DRAFT_278619 [Halenospora varia]
MEETNPELEAFRRQWREEVSAKAGSSKSTESTKAPRRPPPIPRSSTGKLSQGHDGQEDHVEPQEFPGLDAPRRRESDVAESSKSSKEPQSALEHYEKAVERENQGSLGDSLSLYRKAFRMDHKVDQKYKSKHFPPSAFASKPSNPNPSNASPTVPNTAHDSLDGPPQSMKELIAGFSGLSIEPAPPIIENTPPPPCPIAKLPNEIMVSMLTELAILDFASFVRVAQVCKSLAYIVLTEEQIWKRICVGSEVGFGAMHYQWQREVLGGPLIEDPLDFQNDSEEDEATVPIVPPSKELVTETLLDSYSSSWQQMFRHRPRIRFNGCYISTVNYIRPGQASANQVTWNSPVHIVTYYRYLRFFRDGTVISLLSTDEPADVVHHLTKELQDTHREGGALYLPSAVMQNSLRGRWRLSTVLDNPEASLKDSESDLFVETEGANAKYMYRMKLALRNAGKGARNNKLVWQGFWNYNLLTDDTGVFTLRNDKAFFFSRVKSYGTGS